MKYKRFKENINFAGYKNKEFAKLLGISQQSITNYSKKGVPRNSALISELLATLRYNNVDIDSIIKKYLDESDTDI